MIELSSYLDLCTQVYDLSKPGAPVDALSFYRSYARDTAGTILEPMCGTGRYLLPLLQEGFDIQGYDASKHMLQALYAKAAALNLEPDVWQGYNEELNRSDAYGLIFVPAGSFGLITDSKAAMATLKIFYDHLSDNGTLVFEVETLAAKPSQPSIWRGSVWPRPDGKMIIASFLDLPMEDNVSPTVCKYELVDGNQVIQTEQELIKVRLYDPEHLKLTLKDVGFKQVHILKAFDLEQTPSATDELIVFECRK
jgi:hypothetical protein